MESFGGLKTDTSDASVGLNTCLYRSHLSALSDNDIRSGPLAAKTRILYFANNIHTIDDFAEDDMLVVQEGSWYGANEELTAVGVRSGILSRSIFSGETGVVENGTYSHTQDASAIMLEVEVLVGERLDAIDGCAASTITLEEVATLYHEVFDLGTHQRVRTDILMFHDQWLTTRWNLLPL